GRMDRFTNPCGFLPNDSIDLNNDGRADLVIVGYRIGTDDEPSSGGDCTLEVSTLPGTALLCDRSSPRDRTPHVLDSADTLRATGRSAENDLQGQRTAFLDCAVPVWRWGYGNHSPELTPVTDAGIYGYSTTTATGTRFGTFRLEPLRDVRYVRITAGPDVAAGDLLLVHWTDHRISCTKPRLGL
ncbi:MAG TPA: hypothetical protein VGE21_00665, partial [Flavobacteriales bacterium]